jgi:predicted kinase
VLPTQPAAERHREGIYSARFSHRTYARLADSAESCLRAGFDVIVDAAFLDATDRELFRALGKRVGVRRIIISCQADPGVLTERITRRSSGLGDPSDATLPVLDQQLREIRPFEPAEQPHVIVVDTGEPDALRRTLAAVRARTGAE